MDICIIEDPITSVRPFLLELSEEFIKMGHRVSIFSKKQSSQPSYQKKEGIEHYEKKNSSFKPPIKPPKKKKPPPTQ